MKECWSDGALRAFVDRELPADELTRLAAHLEDCPRCAERHRALAARALSVLALVGELREPAAAPSPRLALAPPRTPSRWLAAAAALAAALAALALLTPKKVQAPAESRGEAPPVAAAVRQEQTGQGERPAPQVEQPPRRVPSSARRAPAKRPVLQGTLVGFVPLDDEPIDAGVVMRVALAEGQMQADVIYSSDGRPRAIRLVNNISGPSK